MDFIDKINAIAARIPKQLNHIKSEEATKNAFIMPFISALGYDVFNPMEVTPEFVADVGAKKGEKVDYAIIQDGKPVMLYECKWSGADLDKEHAAQLSRYFAFTEARFGVLTNGILYRFFSDLEKPNKMDSKPFFAFDMLDYSEPQIEELKKFTKPKFDLDDILRTASELKYTREIKREIAQEFSNPSEAFVRFFAKRVYSGILNQKARDRFKIFTTKATRQFTNDLVSARLISALDQESELTDEEQEIFEKPAIDEIKIHTTQEELEGYFVVKSILRDSIDVKRVNIRDVKSYCNVLLDNKRTRPICRLYFNRPQKYIALIYEDKKQKRFPIDDVDAIYDFSDHIIATVQAYDKRFGVPTEKPPKEQRETYTGKKPHSFTFQQERYVVSSWRQAMLELLELLRNHDQDLFERKAVTMVGRKRPYITDNSTELRDSRRISKTDLYVELNLSSQMIANLCEELTLKMGFEPTSLSFETD